jgi:hypothetical protein
VAVFVRVELAGAITIAVGVRVEIGVSVNVGVNVVVAAGGLVAVGVGVEIGAVPGLQATRVVISSVDTMKVILLF